MTGFALPSGIWTGFDNNGNPVPGGKLYTYAAGTSTPLGTYSDQALTVPQSNPVILDGAGRAPIFIPDGTMYKLVLKDASDVELWTLNGVSMPQVLAPAAASPVPAGGIMAFGGAVAPSGYLLCDGTAVSRTTYAALFAAIGTTFGVGNGSTTFNLPDLRQRFPLGKSAAGTGSVLGGTGGAIDHVHTAPVHNHAFTTASGGTHSHTIPRDGWGGVLVGGASTAGRLQSGDGATANLVQTQNDVTSGSGGAHTHTGTTDNGGGSDTTASNPPYQVVNYIIKT